MELTYLFHIVISPLNLLKRIAITFFLIPKRVMVFFIEKKFNVNKLIIFWRLNDDKR